MGQIYENALFKFAASTLFAGCDDGVCYFFFFFFLEMVCDRAEMPYFNFEGVEEVYLL